MSLRKSSRRRKGSNSEVEPKPNARRRCNQTTKEKTSTRRHGGAEKDKEKDQRRESAFIGGQALFIDLLDRVGAGLDPGGHSQKLVYALQERLLGEGFEKHRFGRSPGNDIHGDTVHVPGNVEDPGTGVFADEIGGEVEATHAGHDHVEDGQIDAAGALVDYR